MMRHLALLLTLALHGTWQDQYRSAKGIACCGQRDCRVAQVRMLDQETTTLRVEVNGVAMTLPAGSVHWSEDTQGWWCAQDPEESVSVENTRCVFVAVGM
jgi:hypothetical protein